MKKAFSYFDLGLHNSLKPRKGRHVLHSKQKAFSDVLEMPSFMGTSPQTSLVFPIPCMHLLRF